MAKTISEPDLDAQLVDVYNRTMRTAERVKLNPDLKYAVVLLKLNKNVDAADYPALETAIEGIAGIRKCSIIIDHLTRVNLPADHELWAIIEAHIRIDPIPEEEPTP